MSTIFPENPLICGPATTPNACAIQGQKLKTFLTVVVGPQNYGWTYNQWQYKVALAQWYKFAKAICLETGQVFQI